MHERVKMENECWILSASMPGKIETPKIDRNLKIQEDLGAVIYDDLRRPWE